MPDPMVSLRHAAIRLVDGRYRIVDLGSRHGTFVAGKRVREALLRDGDEILIGVARLKFDDRASNRQLTAPPERVQTSSRRDRRISMATDLPIPPAIEIAGYERLRRDYEKLRTGIELSRALSVEHGLPNLIDRIVSAAFALFAADRVAMVLMKSGRPVHQLARNRSGDPIEFGVSTTMLSEVLSSREGVLTADAAVDNRYERSRSIAVHNICSAMCVPMIHQGEVHGILHLDAQGGGSPFSERDLELLGMVATQAAVALANSLLVERIQTVVADDWKRLERVVHALPTGIALLDDGGRVALMNERASEWFPLLSSAGRGEIVEQVGALSVEELVANTGHTFEIAVSAPARRTFSVSATVMNRDGGAETLLLLSDVTDQRERESREAQQERLALVGQLAGGIAHDFNNLLAVIGNYAEVLTTELNGSALGEDAAEIQRAAMRASELTHQLLAFSRREVVSPQVVDVNELVSAMERLLRRTIGEHIAVTTRLEPRLPAIKADPSKLERVLLNLAVNARDAMPRGGSLHLETQSVVLDEQTARMDGIAPGRYVMIAVSDSGVGMPPEIASHAFEPFFTTKEKGKGTGLGLATAYGLVRQAGGAIAIESEVGAGTSMRLFIPATAEPVTVRPRRELATHSSAGETVLLVEDETALRQITRRLLEQAGYVVVDSPSGETALATAERLDKIDVLLVDLVLPGMSGKQLANRLSDERPDLRVVTMSGFVGEEIAHNGVLDDSYAFLPKPFSRDALLRAVRQAVDDNPVRHAVAS